MYFLVPFINADKIQHYSELYILEGLKSSSQPASAMGSTSTPTVS